MPSWLDTLFGEGPNTGAGGGGQPDPFVFVDSSQITEEAYVGAQRGLMQAAQQRATLMGDSQQMSGNIYGIGQLTYVPPPRLRSEAEQFIERIQELPFNVKEKIKEMVVSKQAFIQLQDYVLNMHGQLYQNGLPDSSCLIINTAAGRITIRPEGVTHPSGMDFDKYMEWVD